MLAVLGQKPLQKSPAEEVIEPKAEQRALALAAAAPEAEQTVPEAEQTAPAQANPESIAPTFKSGMTGVSWDTHHKAWHAHWIENGKVVRDRFKPNNDTHQEMERTRKLAIKRKFEVMMSSKETGMTGVSWSKERKVWRTIIMSNGKQVAKYFRPKNDTSGERERTRKLAVKHVMKAMKKAIDSCKIGP